LIWVWKVWCFQTWQSIIMTQKNRKILREKIELEWSRNRILGYVFAILGYVKLTYPDIFFKDTASIQHVSWSFRPGYHSGYVAEYDDDFFSRIRGTTFSYPGTRPQHPYPRIPWHVRRDHSIVNCCVKNRKFIPAVESFRYFEFIRQEKAELFFFLFIWIALWCWEVFLR
jgi:hypothetical protein